jgi:hypothetical protein
LVLEFSDRHDREHHHHLTLRSERSERLEGWDEHLACGPPFETALRASSG